MKKILVTGGAGYIGSTLCTILIEAGYKVKTVDYLAFGGESLTHLIANTNFEFVRGDIRDADLMRNIMKDCDAIVHLAAIVGDPACAKQPELAESINWDGSVQLFNLAQEMTNIKQFVFASTCSNYGKMKGTDFVVETSELSPVSLYAQLKVKFEKVLFETKVREDLTATALRFATVYGFSTRMRYDLTVNEFTRDLYLGEKLVIFGEQFWRPYCHVKDLARSCKLILESPKEKVRQNVFNVGNTEENYTKRMLADLIASKIPNSDIEFVQRTEDPRDYRVNFTKIQSELGFEITLKVEDGVLEIIKALESGILADPKDKKYQNI